MGTHGVLMKYSRGTQLVLDEYSRGTHGTHWVLLGNSGVLCETRLGVGERGGGAVGLCDGDVHLFLRLEQRRRLRLRESTHMVLYRDSNGTVGLGGTPRVQKDLGVLGEYSTGTPPSPAREYSQGALRYYV